MFSSIVAFWNMPRNAPPREAGAERFGAGKLAGEVGVVEEPVGAQPFDRRVDVGFGLTLLEEQPAQLRDAARPRLEHVERAVVGRARAAGVCHWICVILSGAKDLR